MNRELFHTTYEQLIPRLLDGVPNEQHEEIETVFKIFLERFFAYGVNDTEFPLERRERIFRQGSERLANETMKPPASERGLFLRTKLIAQDVIKLDENAIALAEAKFREPPPEELLDLQAQAKALRQMFEEIISRCEVYGIDWKKVFGRTFSEVNLDINYVLGESGKVSMRMGRLFRSRDHVCNNLPSSPPRIPSGK